MGNCETKSLASLTWHSNQSCRKPSNLRSYVSQAGDDIKYIYIYICMYVYKYKHAKNFTTQNLLEMWLSRIDNLIFLKHIIKSSFSSRNPKKVLRYQSSKPPKTHLQYLDLKPLGPIRTSPTKKFPWKKSNVSHVPIRRSWGVDSVEAVGCGYLIYRNS